MALIRVSIDELEKNVYDLINNFYTIENSLDNIMKISFLIEQNCSDDRVQMFQTEIKKYKNITNDEIENCREFASYIRHIVDTYKCAEEQLANTILGVKS